MGAGSFFGIHVAFGGEACRKLLKLRLIIAASQKAADKFTFHIILFAVPLLGMASIHPG